MSPPRGHLGRVPPAPPRPTPKSSVPVPRSPTPPPLSWRNHAGVWRDANTGEIIPAPDASKLENPAWAEVALGVIIGLAIGMGGAALVVAGALWINGGPI